MNRRGVIIALGVVTGALLVVVGLRQLAHARTFQLFGTLVAHVETPDSVVALTFDDGPVPGVVDSLIAVLRAHDARATFFVTGEAMATAPDAGRKLIAAGHELGNHSYSHHRMVFKFPGTIRSEVEQTDSLIRAAGQQDPILFRPPYGYKLMVLPWFLSRNHRTTVMWDVEPDSYADVAASSQGIVAHVLARVRPGSIIILHPWFPSRATSLAAVAPLVDSLHARGYRVVPAGELLARARH